MLLKNLDKDLVEEKGKGFDRMKKRLEKNQKRYQNKS